METNVQKKADKVRPPQKKRAEKRRNNASKTQVASYKKLIADGQIRGQKGRIIQILKAHGPKTTRELAEIIGTEPGSLTAAISALEAIGTIKIISEKYEARTGRWVSVFALLKGEGGETDA